MCRCQVYSKATSFNEIFAWRSCSTETSGFGVNNLFGCPARPVRVPKTLDTGTDWRNTNDIHEQCMQGNEELLSLAHDASQIADCMRHVVDLVQVAIGLAHLVQFVALAVKLLFLIL